jgi:ankyrin
MTCARTGSAAAVRALLAKGARPEATENWNGQTALMWAAAQGHPSVVQALLDGGASVKTRSKSTRLYVNTGGTTAGKTTTDAEFGGSTPLHFASRAGDIESARLLLGAGADLNERSADGNSPLAVAALSGHTAFAEFLLDRGADANANGAGYTALHAAVLRSDVKLIKSLLAHGADPNRVITQGTPIPRASQYYVFSTQVLGATPFFLAAKYAEPSLMRLLADGGADTRRGLADGTTPLLAAAGSLWIFSGSEDRRERALAPDVLTAQRQDETPTLEAVKLAVELGGDVNGADKTGQTPLHAAASLDLIKVVQFLVERGADVNAKNSRGQTPLALATGPAQDPRTSALLRQLGAKE